MTYEAGFSDGERQAFKDRRNRVTRSMPPEPTEYARGYRDGYLPRSLAWKLREPTPSLAWWQEREAETA